MKYIVFAIDDNSIHGKKVFLRHVDNFTVMGKTRGSFIPTIGMYNGILEDSFVCLKEDFDSVVSPYNFVNFQESFLLVEDGAKGRVYATLINNTEEPISFLGEIKSVKQEDVKELNNWTYRPDLHVYWATKESKDEN